VFFLWKKWRARRSSPPDNPAETLRYLATFMAAGISPQTAWKELPPPEAAGSPPSNHSGRHWHRVSD
jgi:hypothetical protein